MTPVLFVSVSWYESAVPDGLMILAMVTQSLLSFSTLRSMLIESVCLPLGLFHSSLALFVAVANADAYEKLIKLEVAEAIKVYEKAAEDARLEAADKQNLYYIAANILASSGTTDYEYVVKLLQNAFDADPESSYAEGLQKTIDYVKEMQEQAKQAAADANADAK